MGKTEPFIEDYSRAPVPGAALVSGTRIALILIGISLALPGFVCGAQVGTALGLGYSAIAFTVGGLILAIVASFTAMVGADARLSTYMIVEFAFGTRGARVVNFVFAATMSGWFGVNAALFGDALSEAATTLFGAPRGWGVYVSIGSALMVLTTIFGFKALNRLAMLAVPLLVLALITIVLRSVLQAPPGLLGAAHPKTMSLGLAISAVAGGSMVGAASIPDLTRYARTRGAAIRAVFMAFGVGVPLILLAAATPSLVTGETGLLKIFVALGLGVPAVFVIVFSTWTANAANLYSSGLSLAAIFRNVASWKLTLCAGGLGTAVALSGIVDSFIPFLVALAILIPPIAAIYVVDYLFVAQRQYAPDAMPPVPGMRFPAFAAWGLGAAIAFAAANDLVQLTAIPACDALLVSGLSYFILARKRAARPAAVSNAIVRRR